MYYYAHEMKRVLPLIILLFCAFNLNAQELFINSPAAANISKNRLEIRNNIQEYDNFQYFHNSFDINYGITGKLSIYNKFFYTTDANYKFIGDFTPALRYRIYDIDSKNTHYRFAVQSGLRIPIDSQPIVGDKVEYELHPGHVVQFYNFVNDITVPIIDFHTTDNYTWSNTFVVTALFHKLAVSADASYNANFAKGDFKFGNYSQWGLNFGYLVLPRQYESYDDVNLNVYFENKMYYFNKNYFNKDVIFNSGGFRWDGYLGLQTIFFSSLIVEGSYNFPIHSNEYTETQIQTRPASILFSVRYLFFL